MEIADETHDEYQLVVRCRDGSADAFDLLVELYQERVFRFVRRMVGDVETASELTQDAFLKAYRNLGGFRGDSRFSTWLFSIASNLCKNHLASAQVRDRRRADAPPAGLEDEGQVDLAADAPDDRMAPETVGGRRAVQLAVRKAVANLPDAYREPVILRDLNDFTYAEIAVMLEISEGTVKSRIARGRDLIRQELEGQDLLDD